MSFFSNNKKKQLYLTDVVNEDENLTKFSKKLERLVKSSFKMDVDVDKDE